MIFVRTGILAENSKSEDCSKCCENSVERLFEVSGFPIYPVVHDFDVSVKIRVGSVFCELVQYCGLDGRCWSFCICGNCAADC